MAVGSQESQKQKRAMQKHDPLFVLEPVIGLEPTTH